jgi:hypothetical protein
MIALDQEKDFELTPFTVRGNNWTTTVRVDVENYSSIEDIVLEAATLGVEKFMDNDFIQIDFDKPVGYGAVILISNKEINTAVRSDVILANAARHKDAEELKKLIDKRKNG